MSDKEKDRNWIPLPSIFWDLPIHEKVYPELLEEIKEQYLTICENDDILDSLRCCFNEFTADDLMKARDNQNSQYDLIRETIERIRLDILKRVRHNFHRAVYYATDSD